MSADKAKKKNDEQKKPAKTERGEMDAEQLDKVSGGHKPLVITKELDLPSK